MKQAWQRQSAVYALSLDVFLLVTMLPLLLLLFFILANPKQVQQKQGQPGKGHGKQDQKPKPKHHRPKQPAQGGGSTTPDLSKTQNSFFKAAAGTVIVGAAGGALVAGVPGAAAGAVRGAVKAAAKEVVKRVVKFVGRPAPKGGPIQEAENQMRRYFEGYQRRFESAAKAGFSPQESLNFASTGQLPSSSIGKSVDGFVRVTRRPLSTPGPDKAAYLTSRPLSTTGPSKATMDKMKQEADRYLESKGIPVNGWG